MSNYYECYEELRDSYGDINRTLATFLRELSKEKPEMSIGEFYLIQLDCSNRYFKECQEKRNIVMEM